MRRVRRAAGLALAGLAVGCGSVPEAEPIPTTSPVLTTGPPLTTTTIAPPPPQRRIYVVQPGDTLNRIANGFDVSVEALMEENGKEDTLLRIGEQPLVPFERELRVAQAGFQVLQLGELHCVVELDQQRARFHVLAGLEVDRFHDAVEFGRDGHAVHGAKRSDRCQRRLPRLGFCRLGGDGDRRGYARRRLRLELGGLVDELVPTQPAEHHGQNKTDDDKVFRQRSHPAHPAVMGRRNGPGPGTRVKNQQQTMRIALPVPCRCLSVRD